jgi:serine/threonine protein kinase
MKIKRMTRRKTGGVPIFAGAQGCVFRPSLKCRGKVRNYHDGNISKLGDMKSIEDEMREYGQIKERLMRIKHHDKYFGMRASMCEPDTLDHHDLAKFDSVCINMKRLNITAANVNANLDKLRMLNMPDLGIDLKKWMDQTVFDAPHIRQLNDHISTLLIHAVGPMNRLGVIHNDLKSENVMMDAAGNARIIDWGLSGISTEQSVIPPRHFMNNPVTFNRPFSTMVISPNTCKLYETVVLFNASEPPTMEQIKHFTLEVYKRYNDAFDINIYNYYQYTFMSIFGLSEKDAGELLIDMVATYNADILYHFTDRANRTFRLNDYFSTVYRYNTDVWGLMSVFYSIFMLPRKRFVMSNEAYDDMLRRYRDLFRTVVFANGHKLMNVPHIVQQLHRINNAASRLPKPKKTVRFNVGLKRNKSIKRVPTPYPHPVVFKK